MSAHIPDEKAEVIIKNLAFIAGSRRVFTEGGKHIVRWQDSEDFTSTPETFKCLDVVYSYLLAYDKIGGEIKEYIAEDNENSKKLDQAFSLLNSDISYAFERIEKEGFFAVPYLWQQSDKPFDLLDMASLTVDVCLHVLTTEVAGITSKTKTNASKILRRAIKVIKESSSKPSPGLAAWKGWGKINKEKKSKTAKIGESTYFTALCCSALAKYIHACSNNTTGINNDFSLDDLKSLLFAALTWMLSRYDDKNKAFYKYSNDQEKFLYWAPFFLISVCDARKILTDKLDHTFLGEVDKLCQLLLTETNNRISNSAELYESGNMLIDTPAGIPLWYEDRSCLGTVALSLVKYSQDFDFSDNRKDFVISYLFTKVLEEVGKDNFLMMNNHYNLNMLFTFFEGPPSVSIPFKTMKKIIDDIINEKIKEMKDILYSKLRSFETSSKEK